MEATQSTVLSRATQIINSMKTFESIFTKLKSAINSKDTAQAKADDEMVRQTAFPSHNVFDETWFKFELKGGPMHTEILVASATIVKGEMAGTPLPIHCKWYTVEDKGDLKEIEGVSGAFFQPGVDDVGKRICVHAIPASDVMDYHGMPAFQEVGPLTLDGTVMDKAKMCGLSTPRFPVMLDSCSLPGLTVGKKHFLVVGETEMVLEEPGTGSGPVHIKYTETCPVLRHVKNSGTGLSVLVDDKQNSLGLTAESNITRDILTIVLRGKHAQYNALMKQKKAESKENQQNVHAIQVMQKEMEEMTTKCARLEKEITLLKSANNGYMEQRITLIERLTKAEEGVQLKEAENEKLRESLQKLREETEEVRKELEGERNELHFVAQDRLLTQQKSREIKSNYKRLLELLNSVKKIFPNKAALQDFLSYKHRTQQRLEQLQCEIHDKARKERTELARTPKSALSKEEEDVLRAELEKLRLANREKDRQVTELRVGNESLSTELNCLKKKFESVTMTIEKGELLKAQQLEKERTFYESRAAQELMAKTRAAEVKLAEYEAVIFSFKKALNEELKKSAELRQELQFYRSGGTGSDSEERESKLRSIINGLTERLGVKEVEIASIKDINKMLMKSVEELKVKAAGTAEHGGTK